MINVNDVINYEEGRMTSAQEKKFFQKGVNDGSVWKLQGSYGRRAQELLNAGEINYPSKKTYDAYGNQIPTRADIKTQFGKYETANKRKKLRDIS